MTTPLSLVSEPLEESLPSVEMPRLRSDTPVMSTGMRDARGPRVLLIAGNASRLFGGEAVLPLHYFERLQDRGFAVHLITNQRNEAELREDLPPAMLRHITFVPDGKLTRILGRLWEILPARFANFTIGQLLELLDESRAAKLARAMAMNGEIDLVHQVTPVSPRHLSVVRKIGVPVIIGPMNGGMRYPRGFATRERFVDRAFLKVAKHFANLVNKLVPGKREAAALIVANDRTRKALPKGCRGHIIHLPENGVDLSLWRPEAQGDKSPAGVERPTRFVFAGRLVDWKGVDLLLKAAAAARDYIDIHVDIAGDGPWRSKLETLAASLGLQKQVTFHGWLSHADCAKLLANADAMVLPSLCECGGAVVLEAMAMKLPVIAANWGGPADYLDRTCGILIEPLGEYEFIRDLKVAMVKLARDPALRRQMGTAGYEKVCAQYDWARKVEQMVEIYEMVTAKKTVTAAERAAAPQAA